MILLDLFIGFLKVGCFSFGGAYAAIPLIREVVLSYGWVTEEMLTDMIAVSESTPGPIMVNLATYVGSSQAGIPGAAVATLASILPAFVIILLIMMVMKKTVKNKYVQRPLAEGQGNPRPLLLAAGLALVYFGSRRVMKKGLTPIMLIGISACLGILVFGL